jgi:hypothetical protein
VARDVDEDEPEVGRSQLDEVVAVARDDALGRLELARDRPLAREVGVVGGELRPQAHDDGCALFDRLARP